MIHKNQIPTYPPAKFKELYESGLNTHKIANILHLNQKTVWLKIRKLGIIRLNTCGRHPLNENAFDSWNESSAYWFGFLLCDGSIPKIPKRYRLQVRLQHGDINHLRKLASFLKSGRQPKVLMPKTEYRIINRKRYRNYPSCDIKISSPHLIMRLLSMGWREFKGNGKPPYIPPHLWWHFFRGLLDGDGIFSRESVKRIKSREYRLIVGYCNKRETICKWVSNEIHKRGFRRAAIEHKKPIPRIMWYGKFLVTKMLKLIYPNAHVFLDRKRELALDYIKRVDVGDLRI